MDGPRQGRPHFADRFAPVAPGYSDRHRMRAWSTGRAQVRGRRGHRWLDTINKFAKVDTAAPPQVSSIR
jgi:hypothetical protein